MILKYEFHKIFNNKKIDTDYMVLHHSKTRDHLEHSKRYSTEHSLLFADLRRAAECAQGTDSPLNRF